jgi:hypothetical protein
MGLDKVAQATNPSIWEDSECQANLSHIVIPCLKINSKQTKFKKRNCPE